jgi:spermidine synthase
MKRHWQMKLSLFLVSLSILGLEILHIRIFGYALAPILSYCAISFAMLGFAGGAAVLSLWPGILKRDAPRTLSTLAVLLGLSILASAWLLVLIPETAGEFKQPDFSMNVLALLAPSVVPYLLAGLMVTIVFSTLASDSGQVYFVNLVGSAAGCLLPMLLLRTVGVEVLLGLVVVGALASAIPLAGSCTRPARAAIVLLAAAAACVLVPLSGRVFAFKPDPSDQISVLSRAMERAGRPVPVAEFAQWDPVGKIEVYRVPGGKVKVPEEADYRIITVDSGASTLLLNPPRTARWGKELFEQSLYGIGYHVTRPAPDTLVIGVGGGLDVHTALHWGARSVTGVEICATTVGLLEGPYRAFAGLPAGRVRLVNADGRNFSKNTDQRFDLIQLTGVDTLTLASPGAMVLVEDYLYTVEAFRDFLSILKPGGTLVVMRFDREALNLGLIAYHALKLSGIDDPLRHLAVLTQDRLSGVVVKKDPLTPAQVAAIEKVAARRTLNEIAIPHYDMYNVKLGKPVDVVYLPAPEYDAKLEARLRKAGLSIDDPLGGEGSLWSKTPTDDRPYYMAGRIFMWLRHGKALRSIVLIRNTWILVLLLSTVFLVAPLLRKRREGTFGASPLLLLLYFLSIGTGYMAAEIGLIQKTIIFIGHPGGSASLVLTSLLVGSGAGSFLSGRWKKPPVVLIAALAPVCFGALLAVALGSGLVFEHLARLAAVWRWLSCCAVLAAAGLPLGFLFPLGLRAMTGRHDGFIPWAVAVNGFASASASVVALPVGIAYGHTTLVIAGASCYLLALLFAALFGMREKAWTRA